MRFVKPLIVLVMVVVLSVFLGNATTGAPTSNSEPSATNKTITLEESSREWLYLPPGNAEAGRHAFESLRCNACHWVEGGQFAPPVAQPPVPVVIGHGQARLSRAAIAESIISPSHVVPDHVPNVRSGTLSRMGDFSDVMTVRELIDLVAFIRSL